MSGHAPPPVPTGNGDVAEWLADLNRCGMNERPKQLIRPASYQLREIRDRFPDVPLSTTTAAGALSHATIFPMFRRARWERETIRCEQMAMRETAPDRHFEGRSQIPWIPASEPPSHESSALRVIRHPAVIVRVRRNTSGDSKSPPASQPPSRRLTLRAGTRPRRPSSPPPTAARGGSDAPPADPETRLAASAARRLQVASHGRARCHHPAASRHPG